MKCIFAFLLVFKIFTSTSAELRSVSFDFTVDFPMLNADIISNCSDDDVDIIFGALQDIIQDTGNHYLSKNNFPGLIDDVHIDSPARRLKMLRKGNQDQVQSTDSHGLRSLGFNFSFYGGAVCKFCWLPKDNIDGRRLQGGIPFQLEDDINFVNAHAGQALNQVVGLETSDTCRTTKGKWTVSVTMIVT